MKPKIRISGKEISKFELGYTPEEFQSLSAFKKWSISFTGNIVAGLFAAGIILILNQYNIAESKRLDRANKKSAVIWQARVDATKSNMAALSRMNNYISYEFENELRQKLENLAYFDDAKNKNQMYHFEELERINSEVFSIINANNHLLPERMADKTTQFLNSIDSLIKLQLLTVVNDTLINGLVLPIDLVKGAQYSDKANEHINKTVEWLKFNFSNSYSNLEREYRVSFFDNVYSQNQADL